MREPIYYIGRKIEIERMPMAPVASPEQGIGVDEQHSGALEHPAEMADECEPSGKPSEAGGHEHGTDHGGEHVGHGGQDSGYGSEPMGPGEEPMYVIKIDGQEIIAHQMNSGYFHTHELPFSQFTSIEMLAEAYVNYLHYGTYHGNTQKPEQTHGH
jgi:hypothetical protein